MLTGEEQVMNQNYDIICIGMALVDSIIRGFDPEPVSASGYRAESGSLNVGGEAVNEAMAAAKLGMKTGILCSLGEDAAGDLFQDMIISRERDTMILFQIERVQLCTLDEGFLHDLPRYDLPIEDGAHL